MHTAISSLIAASVSIFLAIPIGWVLGKLIKFILITSQRHIWRRQSVIYAEYEAPGGLRPGEVAYLYDKAFGKEELLATLFDLELRNKLKLTALPGKIDPEVDFKIEVIAKPVDDDLLDFEQEVLVTVISYGTNATWSYMKADTAIWDSNIEMHLEADLQNKGFMAEPSTGINAYVKYLFIGLVVAGLTVTLPIIMSNKSVAVSANDTYAGLQQDISTLIAITLGICASFAYGLAAYYGFSAYYRALDLGIATRSLGKMWPHLAGFREYIRVVEQDRIKFENSTLREAARQHALPYAIALGLSTDWQDRFK